MDPRRRVDHRPVSRSAVELVELVVVGVAAVTALIWLFVLVAQDAWQADDH